MIYDYYSYDELDNIRQHHEIGIFFYINDYIKEYIADRKLYCIENNYDTKFFWFSGKSYIIVNRNGDVFGDMKKQIYVIH